MTLQQVKDFITNCTIEDIESICDYVQEATDRLLLEHCPLDDESIPVDNKREKAIKWWNGLNDGTKSAKMIATGWAMRSRDSLTGREIQSIWESQQSKFDKYDARQGQQDALDDYTLMNWLADKD